MNDIYALEFQLANQRGFVSGVRLAPGSITLDGWIRFASAGPPQHRLILAYGHPITEMPGWYYITLYAQVMGANGHLMVGAWNEPAGLGYELASTTDLRDDTWHHFAWTIDHYTNTGRLFIDGIKEAEGTQIFYPHPEDHEIYVGWRGRLTPALALDDLRLSRVARYHENFTPQPLQWGIDGAVEAYWHLDEGVGDVAYDASPYARHLVLEAAPSWISGIVGKGVIIMPIISHVRIKVPYYAAAPLRIPEKWAENLKNEAEWLSEKRQLVIPDETAYQDRISEVSHGAYAPYVNPTFWTRAGLSLKNIKNRHLDKIRKSFKKWSRGLSHAFATVEGVFGKRFKEAVDLRRDLYSEGAAERTLPFVGTKFELLGPAAGAGYWLTNDPKTLKVIEAGEVVGSPYRICVHLKKAALKAALTERLVQAGVLILESGLDVSIIAEQNGASNEIVQGYVDPALSLVPFTTGGASHVDFVVSDGQLYLDIQVATM